MNNADLKEAMDLLNAIVAGSAGNMDIGLETIKATFLDYGAGAGNTDDAENCKDDEATGSQWRGSSIRCPPVSRSNSSDLDPSGLFE